MLPLLFCALASAILPAQEPERPRLQAARTDEEIRIDGYLAEPAWEHAGRIPELTQVEPYEGQAATTRTEVLVLFDERALYFGFRCHDPEPEKIVTTQMKRDGDPRSDDQVAWILDTFQDRRRAYSFVLTAAGGRRDILLNSGGLRRNPWWDGVWKARTRVHSEGWTAEVEIPFASIAFDPSGNWGFNVQRFRGNGRTLDRWASASRSYDLNQVFTAGDLTGVTGIDQGLGLELKESFKATAQRDSATNDSDLLGAPSVDLTWRITPTLTASATWNTDFAETEVDELQVNLTRFPLFFPEKRDFFLEDNSLFEFGPVLAPKQTPDFLPYFSRTIGLNRGQEVPLKGGVRAAGAVGPLEMGLLVVQTESAWVNAGKGVARVPEGDLLVFRPALTLRKGLQVGAFLAAGDPASDSPAQTAGADLRFTRKGVLGGSFGLNIYGMRALEQLGDSRDVAYGLQTRVQTDDWAVQYDASAVGSEFRPALGFVRRRAFHKHRLDADFMPRTTSGPIRSWLFGIEPTIYQDLSNDLESYRVNVQFFGLQLHSGDQLLLSVIPEGDNPKSAFMPVRGSVIPAGDHDWVQGQVVLASSTVRPVSATVSVVGGSWYNGGSLSQFSTTAEWRPSPLFRLAARYEQSHAEIPGGDFTTRLERANLDLLLSPSLYWENIAQSDNVSRTLGWQSRLRWIYEDGREVFLVATTGWIDRDDTLIPTSQDLTLKLVYALRF